MRNPQHRPVVVVASLVGESRGGMKSLLAGLQVLPEGACHLVLRSAAEQTPGQPLRHTPLRRRVDLDAGTTRLSRQAAIGCGLMIESAAILRSAWRRDARAIHANDFEAMLVSIAASKTLRIPLLLHLRDQPSNTRAMSFALRHAAGVITVSRALERWIGSNFPANEVPVRTIYNPGPAPRDRLTRDAARALFGESEEGPLVGYIGAYEERKGQLEFLREVWPAVTPSARLVMAGPVSSRSYWTACAAEAARQSNPVRLLEYVPAVESALPAFDVIVLRSLREGLPRVAIEAAYAGVPVVLSDVQGGAEAVSHGLTGFVVPRPDAAGFAAGINRLLEHPGLRAAFGSAAASRAARLFGRDRFGSELMSFYDHVAGC